jgi:hypothetical protein
MCLLSTLIEGSDKDDSLGVYCVFGLCLILCAELVQCRVMAGSMMEESCLVLRCPSTVWMVKPFEATSLCVDGALMACGQMSQPCSFHAVEVRRHQSTIDGGCMLPPLLR